MLLTRKYWLTTLLIGLVAWQGVQAEVRLPKLFGAHMVVQRHKPVPVWGWADANEKLTVRFNGQAKQTKAGKDGKWRVNLDAMEAGGPYQLIVAGKYNTLTIEDVLVGEVWVCSGQSNMEFTVRGTNNAREEFRTANYPQIRHFKVKNEISLAPKDDVEGEWQVCSPQTVRGFTAVGYFFARELHKNLNVPIGLVNTSWGGTHSETWTSKEGMQQDEELRKSVVALPTSLESARQQNQERLTKLLQERQVGLPAAGTDRSWSGADVDDRRWATIELPRYWSQESPSFDGVVWLRREVVVPDNVNLKNVVLRLGPIDQRDSTYVNGQLVGTTRTAEPARNYTLPEGVLKPGQNVIAVRVEDYSWRGGFAGKADMLELVGTNFEIPLNGSWRYRVATVLPSSYTVGPNSFATLLYNAMVHPLIPYAMQGVIWYQGESNAARAYQYRKAFPLMIRDWRQQWARANNGVAEEFPFLFVQLANFNAGNGNSQQGSTWAELREAQTMALQLPKTGMAVTSDIGESNDIHPRNKQDVGKRLAAQAMKIAYGGTDVAEGPVFERMQTDGKRAILTFKSVGSGLVVKDRYGYLKGFEVAGNDRTFQYARAEIQGDKVIIWSESVTEPVAVRYGWADDNGESNLYNKEGFPAAPFRTDTWKGITEGKSFSAQ